MVRLFGCFFFVFHARNMYNEYEHEYNINHLETTKKKNNHLIETEYFQWDHQIKIKNKNYASVNFIIMNNGNNFIQLRIFYNAPGASTIFVICQYYPIKQINSTKFVYFLLHKKQTVTLFIIIKYEDSE